VSPSPPCLAATVADLLDGDGKADIARLVEDPSPLRMDAPSRASRPAARSVLFAAKDRKVYVSLAR
jgi:hypothetical protein